MCAKFCLQRSSDELARTPYIASLLLFSTLAAETGLGEEFIVDPVGARTVSRKLSTMRSCAERRALSVGEPVLHGEVVNSHLSCCCIHGANANTQTPVTQTHTHTHHTSTTQTTHTTEDTDNTERHTKHAHHCFRGEKEPSFFSFVSCEICFVKRESIVLFFKKTTKDERSH